MRLKKMHAISAVYVLASMTQPEPMVTASDLARVHRNQGYSKIAVHYVIERDGSIHRGRARDEPGCLAPGMNDRALQVCLIGGVDSAMNPSDTFTAHQRAALRHFLSTEQAPAVFDKTCACLKETE